MAMLRPTSEMKEYLPNGWIISPLKYLVDYNQSVLSENTSADFEFDYVDIGSVTYGKGIEKFQRILFKDAPSRARRIVNKDDVILSTVRTYLKAVAAIPYREVPIVVSTGFLTMTAKKHLSPRFLYYAVQSEYFVDDIEANSYGISYPAINASAAVNRKIVLPPILEQQAIADYLDDRCSKIDEIIAEATESIEEYKQMKQSVFFEAVTKGLDKNVLMKDSGIDWSPSIPKHWNVRPISAIYRESKETGRDDLPILLVSINTGISDREIDNDERDRKVIRSEDKNVYKVVHPNYLAYNMMRAWQGAFGAATIDGLVSPAYVVAMPKTNVNSAYIEYLLRTSNAMEHIRGLSYGVADFRLRLYWPYFKTIKVPFPPVGEQDAIVEHIKLRTSQIDSLITEKQSLVEDLQAYKKSLIYEVVTGKRKVV